MSNTNPVLETKDLVRHFPLTRGIIFSKQIGAVQAVDGVSIALAQGETLGIVGESGCGKSTLARLIMALDKPTSGSVLLEGQDMASLSGGALRRRRKDIQLVMQDPYTSLNPRMTVGDIVAEPLVVHKLGNAADRKERVQELLEIVGLSLDHINRYPHQFSGGQRQRIGIARALALNPKVIVCDEPVSALDVSVQAQVVNLLERLQEELGLSYLFIAHDLSVVRHISNRVGVMYLGKIVEIGDRARIYENPAHPYSQALLSAVPVPDPLARESTKRIPLDGDVPSPANPPSGCRFRTRCWKATEICEQQEPPLLQIAAGHEVACHHPDV